MRGLESRLGFRVAGKIVQRQGRTGPAAVRGTTCWRNWMQDQDYRLAADAARAQVASARSLTWRQQTSGFQALKTQNCHRRCRAGTPPRQLRPRRPRAGSGAGPVASQPGQSRKITALVVAMSGVVTAIDAEPGQVVSAGARGAPLPQDGSARRGVCVPRDKVAHDGLRSRRAWLVRRRHADRPCARVAASADAATRTFRSKVAIDAARPAPRWALRATVYATPRR